MKTFEASMGSSLGAGNLIRVICEGADAATFYPRGIVDGLWDDFLAGAAKRGDRVFLTNMTGQRTCVAGDVGELTDG